LADFCLLQQITPAAEGVSVEVIPIAIEAFFSDVAPPSFQLDVRFADMADTPPSLLPVCV
jgi:hypothetical protein